MLKDNGTVWDGCPRDFLRGEGLGTGHPSRKAVKEWVLKTYQGEKPSFLDAACGMGVDSEVLSGIVEYTGMDKTENMVSFLKENGISVVKGDVRQMPFKDGEFDIVQARAIFEHLPDIEEVTTAMSECIRVARRHCVFSFFIPPAEEEHIDWNGSFYNNTYKRDEIEEYLTSTGLKWEKMHVPRGGCIDDYDIFFIFKPYENKRDDAGLQRGGPRKTVPKADTSLGGEGAGAGLKKTLVRD
jgi:SAM-dependent methyltransferase